MYRRLITYLFKREYSQELAHLKAIREASHNIATDKVSDLAIYRAEARGCLGAVFKLNLLR